MRRCSARRRYASLFSVLFSFFFFSATATTELYTLSLHDALPISSPCPDHPGGPPPGLAMPRFGSSRFSAVGSADPHPRSEEHTSELQSLRHLVCRLLLEKKKEQLYRR